MRPDACWSIPAPRYTGALKTRLRFRLDPRSGEGPKPAPVYSNEFEGSINIEQFTVKREYKPGGIMDPYDD